MQTRRLQQYLRSQDHSKNSDLDYADTAATFGSALAIRAENATLVQYGSNSSEIDFNKSDSILTLPGKFGSLGGTDTAGAVRRHFNGHDRVIILTDEQAGYYGTNPTSYVPDNVPVYTFNLVGYQRGHGADGPNRYTFGGLTDASFGTIDLVERGRNAAWPWED